jgi:hypothetical protein
VVRAICLGFRDGSLGLRVRNAGLRSRTNEELGAIIQDKV